MASKIMGLTLQDEDHWKSLAIWDEAGGFYKPHVDRADLPAWPAAC